MGSWENNVLAGDYSCPQCLSDRDYPDYDDWDSEEEMINDIESEMML